MNKIGYSDSGDIVHLNIQRLIYKRHARSHGAFEKLLQNITNTAQKLKWLKTCHRHGFGDVK